MRMDAVRDYLLSNQTEDLSKQLNEFASWVESLKNHASDSICIWGAGYEGKQLYRELQNRLIYVDFFCDDDMQKHGYLLEERYCIDMESLTPNKDTTLVIVSSEIKDKNIVQYLTKEGFSYMIEEKELRNRMKYILPVPGLQQLDYFSQQDHIDTLNLSLIEKFKEILFCTCKYYESRKKTT